MINNKGTARWKGGLISGSGEVSTQSNALKSTFTFSTRFGDDMAGTNPEELVGAAFSACYSMFLASLLEKAGHAPTEIKTTAEVSLVKDERGPFIGKIHLHTEGTVNGIDQAEFEKQAQAAKKDCPLARALDAVPEIVLTVVLK